MRPRALLLTLATVLLATAAGAQTACTTDPECVDSDVCNGTETCVGGFCQPGTPLDCNDGNTATTDTCDATAGCQHAALIGAKRLTLRAGPINPLKTAIRIVTLGTIRVSSPPFSGGPNDPVLHGGSLRVKAASGEFDVTYLLPAANWSYVGQDPLANRGFWYKDKTQASGPIRFLVIRDGVMARGLGTGSALGVTLGQDPQAIDVVLTLGDAAAGGTKYCMRFGGQTTYVQDLRFRASDAPAPAACP